MTVDDLKKELKLTDAQRDTRIEETVLHDLAAFFENSDDYVERLGLRPGQQTDVKDKVIARGNEAGVKLALKYWRERNPYEATYRALLVILLSLKKGTVAVSVGKYLSSKGKLEYVISNVQHVHCGYCMNACT